MKVLQKQKVEDSGKRVGVGENAIDKYN